MTLPSTSGRVVLIGGLTGFLESGRVGALHRRVSVEARLSS